MHVLVAGATHGRPGQDRERRARPASAHDAARVARGHPLPRARRVGRSARRDRAALRQLLRPGRLGAGRGFTDDASAATVTALERGTPGVYNITDDEPARVSEWLPCLAEVVGAKPPIRVPTWLARVMAGAVPVQWMTEGRGASNEKAKRELDWEPAWRSWRDGFRNALAETTPGPGLAARRAG